MEISLTLIPHKLTWVSAKLQPAGRVLNSDIEFPYIPLHSEIGPIDLTTTIEFCKTLESMIEEGPTIHYCSIKPIEKSNGAYLIGAFLVLVLNQTPQQAWENFQNLPVLFLHYRDSAPGLCHYKCSILHCLQILHKAVKYNWIRYKDFSPEKHRKLYSIDNGDITWIVPNKLAVFSSPYSDPRDTDGIRNYTPEDYSAIFAKIGIRTVVRLDGNHYESERFSRNGVRYYDLSFSGPLPPTNVVNTFLEIIENTEFSVGVHCKAGLGKSPTLVGIYVMKRFDVSAEEYIAWARICRPGSIIGAQQEYLKQMESKCIGMRARESFKFSLQSENITMRSRFLSNSGNSALDVRCSMKTFSKSAIETKRSSISRTGITPRFNRKHSRGLLI